MRLRLEPATPTLLAAAETDLHALDEALGVRIPEGWPEFPEAIPFTREVLEQHPDQAGWWMYFFIDPQAAALVGSGGFKGPPQDGGVEIGYEVAPEFRGRGVATRAAGLLIDVAWRDEAVTSVTAHTLAQANASTGVLTRLGFGRAAELVDEEVGSVWQWPLDRPS